MHLILYHLWYSICVVLLTKMNNIFSQSVHCLSTLTEENRKPPFLIFAWDSRIRQLRNALIHELTGQDYDLYSNPNGPSELIHVKYGSRESYGDFYQRAHIRFEWGPFLRGGGNGEITEIVRRMLNPTLKPSLLVMGAGIWTMRHCHLYKMRLENCLLEYRR